MRSWFEAIVFTTVAVAILIVGFGLRPQEGGDSGGQGGDALISLSYVPPTVAELVETWDAPRETPQQLVTEIAAPDVTAVKAPPVVQFELTQAPSAAAQIQLFQPKEQEKVVVDTDAPPPPPEPEPEPLSKPKPKPVAKPKPKLQPKPKKAVVAKQTSDGRAEQKSAGSGGRSEAGAGGKAAATTSPGQIQKLESVWGAKVRGAVVRRKRTPRGAKGSGTVLIYFKVSRDGALLAHKIQRSSGNPLFDKAAIKAVTSVRRFPRAPKKLPRKSGEFVVPLQFEN